MRETLWICLAILFLAGATAALVTVFRRTRRRSLLAVLAASSLLVSPVAAVAVVAPSQDNEASPLATDQTPVFDLSEGDLEFILAQIEISEAHSERVRAGDTTAAGLLCEDRNDTSGKCVRDPSLPHGLRTVDGSFNNLEFNTDWGSANEIMPRLLGTDWREAGPTTPGSPLPEGDRSVCGARRTLATPRPMARCTTLSHARSAT
ncbi:peroxidase family protein [Ornithinimicrobium sp. INDO-MA30-4]|uniref:peroxidase family protein n=1 Tax=Ornithinimicrobium sp. INDO-MA30-4 TaxID=2908651 RepID=UPI001F3C3177|nr:peroxidase family protein [Ornithinimicrobium sp. INDO-MA30-4]UJH70033.1 peroxidase family protein [Ornithinimicrobium sp. INDO-MA30-4]